MQTETVEQGSSDSKRDSGRTVVLVAKVTAVVGTVLGTVVVLEVVEHYVLTVLEAVEAKYGK